jgi:hypothetical protein
MQYETASTQDPNGDMDTRLGARDSRRDVSSGTADWLDDRVYRGLAALQDSDAAHGALRCWVSNARVSHDRLFGRFESLSAFCSAFCLKVGGFAYGLPEISRFLLEAGQENSKSISDCFKRMNAIIIARPGINGVCINVLRVQNVASIRV